MSSRKPEHPVHDIIVNRWSSRAMSGEAVPHGKLMSLFEAARWAPSSFNNQPWRFVYVTKDSDRWDDFFNLLVPFNQAWAKNAGALVVIVSRNTFDFSGDPGNTHSFSAGAAWQNIALQASLNNLVAHGASGFDYDKARADLNIPADYTIDAMVILGKPGKVEDLPEEMRGGEVPSDRKPLKELVFEGEFTA